jgi:ankyrin repeat protein
VAALGGCTPTLSEALRARDHEALRRVLDHRQNLGPWNENGATPLHFAVSIPAGQYRYRADPEAIRMLVAHGADVNAKNKRGETPLHLAAREQEVEAMRVLLDNGAAIDARSVEGATPLHLATPLTSSADAIQLLLARGADPNATDNAGRTPLHWVADLGSGQATDVVAELVSHGAKIEAPDNAGRTPLHAACSRYHYFVVRTASYSRASGHFVNGRQVIDSVEAHSSESDPEVKPDEFNVDVAMVKELLARGAAVNSLTNDHKTPLDIAEHMRCNLRTEAAAKIQSPLVAILRAAGGREGAEESAGRTPKKH